MNLNELNLNKIKKGSILIVNYDISIFKKSDELYCEGTSDDICFAMYKNKRYYITQSYLYHFSLKPIIEVREDKLKLIGII
tara:strand:- start:116 stop:358 length:243 start_codon:yes stop_codon:yes gene_type:complete